MLSRNRIRFVSFFLFLFTFQLNSFSNSRVDSLIAVSNDQEMAMRDRAFALIELQREYERSDPEKSREYGQQGLGLTGIDTAYYPKAKLEQNIGYTYYLGQNFQEALPWFEKALRNFEKANEPKSVGITSRTLCVLYNKLGAYNDAFDIQLKGLKIFEELGDLKGQAYSMINLGNVLVYQEQYAEALDYYRRAQSLAEKSNDSYCIADANQSLSLAFQKSEATDSAMFYGQKALELLYENRDLVTAARLEHNLALIQLNKGDVEDAEERLLNALSVFDRLPAAYHVELATFRVSLAKVYTISNQPDKAIPLLDQAIPVFESKGMVNEWAIALGQKASSLASLKNYELAYANHVEYKALKDSIRNLEVGIEIAELNEKYESEKKEKEILELQNANIEAEKRQWVILNLSIGILAILVIVFLVYRQVKLREAAALKIKLKQHVRELDVLREQIEKGTTEYLSSKQFTLSRESVNELLKEDLSDRELDVFMLLIEGLTNKEIGEKLFVSVSTIKYHLQNIYLKLDVNNRKDAVQALTTRTETAA